MVKTKWFRNKITGLKFHIEEGELCDRLSKNSDFEEIEGPEISSNESDPEDPEDNDEDSDDEEDEEENEDNDEDVEEETPSQPIGRRRYGRR